MTNAQFPPKTSSVPATSLEASGSRPGDSGLIKRVLPVCLLFAVLLTGCARNYIITLSNGARITAKGKPKLQGSSYVFKDAQGQPAQVSAGRVREIAPASMSKEEGSQFFK